MKIGIIGAGIAGLAAGRELSRAGHEVVVIEKSREMGGRLATGHYGEGGETVVDYGVSHLSAGTACFRGFVAELLEEKLVRVWGDRIHQHDGEKLQSSLPDSSEGTLYAAPEGVNRIAHHLSRWVDILPGEKVGGLTHIGAGNGKKRPWMVNLTSFRTFEADAVIIATPAPEAYGALLTTQDEVNILKLIREIDEIHYDPCYVISAGYGQIDNPGWDAIRSQNESVRMITNESSKRELPETALTIYSSAEFARAHRKSEPTLIAEELLGQASSIAGEWVRNPVWKNHHPWRFFRPIQSISRPYLEFETSESPLAVVGEYFNGNDVEHSYCSGVELARKWIERYRV